MNSLYSKVAKLLQTILNDKATLWQKAVGLSCGNGCDGGWFYKNLVFWLAAKP